MNKTFQSHVKLSDDAKTALVETLNDTLATTSDLRSQVKQAHWNIKGPQFFARHELFDALAARLTGHADSLAERAATLGGYAQGTIRLSAERSKLPEYDLSAVDGRQHIQVLVERFADHAAFLRDAIGTAEVEADPVTEDLLTEVLRSAELDLWFLESHRNV